MYASRSPQRARNSFRTLCCSACKIHLLIREASHRTSHTRAKYFVYGLAEHKYSFHKIHEEVPLIDQLTQYTKHKTGNGHPWRSHLFDNMTVPTASLVGRNVRMC